MIHKVTTILFRNPKKNQHTLLEHVNRCLYELELLMSGKKFSTTNLEMLYPTIFGIYSA